MTYTLHHGDCLDVLRTLGTVDAIVTDPPAGIAFMGAAWDGDKGGRDQWVQWLGARLRAARALIRPGGYALVWALPRTSHWTALAIEEAGWKIQDRVSHIFGSGFPKHKSHLKPAVEDWWLAYNPGGTRSLNIDACRVPSNGDVMRRANNITIGGNGKYRGGKACDTGALDGRRYPPHLLLTHSADCEPGACIEVCPVRVLGQQSGYTDRSDQRPFKLNKRQGADAYWAQGGGGYRTVSLESVNYTDTGTAARYFPQFYYAPKASRRERNRGCEGLEEREKNNTYGDGLNSATKVRTLNQNENGVDRGLVPNHHPTVKPLALMQWLVRLITPEGGTVLDPFAGSGTTGVAALAEGRSFIGIEKDESYFKIAEKRLADAAMQQRMALEEAS